ncbi:MULTISPECIES: pyridoxamine 5'-phosphate oxidase family protein [Haloferax]|uniref:Pyridoxamine 5'-phosphate oxidase family protein n=2 Tax=Haloferax TaxID=2251 RepID=A0A6G1Z597_9EURY|nr:MULTISPECIES: pyridoxamine 5'-phosphate oxidase family protein [Haloferax]KAB1189001.1 pyridoxamine 5'-phosphate oxidase family protein [Haloferax sp. CBA1149]MRW81726.1 pyridoxamine 5'-phosphate oxidase family protein [Haloferax marinisediminis]
MRDIRYVYTVGMDAAAISKRLDEASSGVLSLADGNRSYAIPVHVHLDEPAGRLLFRLTDDGHSKKLDYIEKTDEATFICYEDAGKDSWSIMARGPIRVLPDEDLPDETTINRLYGGVRVFDEDVDDLKLHIVELVYDELTGRETAR